jgi:arginase family enzyme
MDKRIIDFVGMDLVEVAPPYDTADVTALAGATLMLDYLCLQAQHVPVHNAPKSRPRRRR